MSPDLAPVTSSEIVFLTASSADLAEVLAMMQAYYTFDGLEYTPEVEAAVASLIAQPEHGKVWLLEYQGHKIGYAVVTYWYSLEFRGKAAFLDEIYLQQDYREQGLGSQVIQSVAEACRSQGIRSLRLEVEHENQRAFHVYQKNGFFAHPRHLMTKWL